MRTPQMIDPLTESMDDCDDIFGPPRSYPTGHNPPRNRPSMISSKYKQKEERRKVLKISLNKLKKIDDPEASLCRSVLINNTMKRLQQETRNEKMQKQQLNYPRCYNDDSYLNIKTEFLKNEKHIDEMVAYLPESNDKIEDLVIEKDFHAKLEEEINHVSASDMDTLNCLVTNDDINLSTTPYRQQNNRPSSKKRTFDDMGECDVQDVLSQFYMPPTPRMLTAIDEDEDVNVVDDDPLTKRLKSEDQTATGNKNTELVCHASFSNYSSSVTSFINNNLPLSKYSNSCLVESDSSNPYSCGHASMLGELQSNVYHSLITSLET